MKSSKKNLPFFNNGWFKELARTINTIEDTIGEMVKSKSNSSCIRITNHKEAKKYIESISNKTIELRVFSENTVYSKVEIILNIDFEEISISDYVKLRQSILYLDFK